MASSQNGKSTPSWDLAGVGLLGLASVAALIWANSPWAGEYEAIFATPLRVEFGVVELVKPLRHWINDGLMAVFFFLIGLEIKREMLAGELDSARKAALPAVAAIGGMLVPAGLYLAAQRLSGGAVEGWGIPMATDIAFALGALMVLGSRVPKGLKVFLTALAIVDDIGAILVIAAFYTDSISFVSLGLGVALLFVALAASRAGVRSAVFYFVLGTLVWLAFLKSGVHATVAALLMALTIPVRTRIDGAELSRSLRRLLEQLHRSGLPADTRLNTPAQQRLITAMGETVEHSEAPLQRLERALHPLVTYAVLPVFALANSGVDLSDGLGASFTHPITLGILLGLVVGKPIGVTAFAWLAVKLGAADLPRGVGWTHVLGAGSLAGIGFTMALFIGSLAFDAPGRVALAKIGIMSASVIALVLGVLLLRGAGGRGDRRT